METVILPGSLHEALVLAVWPKGNGTFVLLTKRDEEPFEGSWALPGAFVMPSQTTAETAIAVLSDLGVPVNKDRLKFRALLDTPGRDPRGHVLSSVFTTEINHSFDLPKDSCASWQDVASLWELDFAFDHEAVVSSLLNVV